MKITDESTSFLRSPESGPAAESLTARAIASTGSNRLGPRAARRACVLALASCIALALSREALADGITRRASVRSLGHPSGQEAQQASFAGAVSANGRFVAFETVDALVSDDTNGRRDVYVHDLQTNQTTRASVATDGSQRAAPSENAALSGDGRYVVFQSTAAFVGGDSGTRLDIYLRDRVLGVTTLVSRTASASSGNRLSENPCITPDGRYVAFESKATNLAPGDGDTETDILVYDHQLGTLVCATCHLSGLFRAPALSDDARVLAFVSGANGLVAGDGNSRPDAFVLDRSTHALISASRAWDGPFQSSAASGIAVNEDIGISGDGRYVVYSSSFGRHVPGDDNQQPDVFLFDASNGVTERISVTSADSQGNVGQAMGASLTPNITSDGRYVTFASAASNLVTGDANGAWDVFLHDRLTRKTTLVSVDLQTQSANGDSSLPAISADARAVVFESKASDLVTGDTNGHRDIFARINGSTDAIMLCGGDGANAVCPCANHSELHAAKGCRNSLGHGARLRAEGRASLSADTMVLHASEMTNGFAVLFQGTIQTSGITYGDGVRCASGAIRRLWMKSNVAGASAFPSAGDTTLSMRGAITSPGLRIYHVWYRDATSFCTPSPHNVTNALAVTWGP